MIHNDRFLRNTMKATSFHNDQLQGASAAGSSGGTVPVETAPGGGAPAPGSKLRVLIRKPGVMGIRLEADPATGLPCVKAVSPESEAGKQGLTAGYSLKQVFTPHAVVEAKRAKYKELLDLIGSLDRPIGLKFCYGILPPKKKKKKEKEKKKEKKVEKHEKQEKKAGSENGSKKKRKRDNRSSSSSSDDEGG